MTEPQTLIFDAIDAYIADITTALPGIPVLDGPQVLFPTDSDFVVVGADDLLGNGMVTAVDGGDQQWEDLGAFTRREVFTIASTYVAWTGSTDPVAFADCRARAKTSLTAVGASLRPSPAGTGDAMLSSTLNRGRAGWCGMYVGRVQQISNGPVDNGDGTYEPGGTAIHVQFYLDCVAYI